MKHILPMFCLTSWCKKRKPSQGLPSACQCPTPDHGNLVCPYLLILSSSDPTRAATNRNFLNNVLQIHISFPPTPNDSKGISFKAQQLER
jgi:hypothetical protein